MLSEPLSNKKRFILIRLSSKMRLFTFRLEELWAEHTKTEKTQWQKHQT